MISPLKIIFAGTPVFAAEILKALLHSSHQIIAVYTQPDQPSGRGLKLTASPVKILAQSEGLPIFQAISLKDYSEQTHLAAFNADVMVVAAYGMLLPQAILNLPKFGCINVHPSLLPRFRGAAPIERTILAGDAVTGVTIMQMDAGLDTGPMLLQRSCPISAQETSASLHDKLATLGAQSLIETLDLLAQGKIHAIPQDNQFATYAAKISKEEAYLHWEESAVLLSRKVRAFNPRPIAYTFFKGERLRIFEAIPLVGDEIAEPGTLISASSEGIDVATGDGILRLLQVQVAGGKVMSAADFYRGKNSVLVKGEKFT
ncbi:MAG: methionyl-tRNA formyltransferase [Gammaproteobacteria bacterium RIFCSPHIGHO2_12_FULL_38_14]|nr:MAG: methionyl-tRNA formyltransferase [Gammaproteobacteria bacterium RIFCSPHIGHO2_12_FULL_38_14]